jgi:hypothetical protein
LKSNERWPKPNENVTVFPNAVAAQFAEVVMVVKAVSQARQM